MLTCFEHGIDVQSVFTLCLMLVQFQNVDLSWYQKKKKKTTFNIEQILDEYGYGYEHAWKELWHEEPERVQ